MALLKQNEGFIYALKDTRRSLEHCTLIFPHDSIHGLKLPAICLLQTSEGQKDYCYLVTITKKMSVSTFDTRLTFKKFRLLKHSSFDEIKKAFTGIRCQKLWDEKVKKLNGLSLLTPKLSSSLLKVLADDEGNQAAIEAAASLFPKINPKSNHSWAQEDAILGAMKAFGIKNDITPDKILLKKGSTSALGTMGVYLYEDNVVHADATELPGFERITSDMTGKAVFSKGDEQLIIYTANKLPLEKMLGVDLIYINNTKGSIVMLQYKMLEEANSDNGKDWIYRPDAQLKDEIARMNIPRCKINDNEYRMEPNPFYFKFVKRKLNNNTEMSFVLTLGHLKKVMQNPTFIGPKGGLKISYDQLKGHFLKNEDFINLLRSGYIGTYSSETDALKIIVDEVSKGNKALVIAWQQFNKRDTNKLTTDIGES